jgi:YHS domain-containing protein
MNMLIDSLASAALAVIIAGALPNLGAASEKALLNPVQLGRTGSLSVLAEQGTKSHHRTKLNVMLKGYDPVAYFKQGKAVRGKPTIRSTYNGVTYFFASKADKADFDQSPAKFEPQYGGFCANSMANGKKSDSDPTAFFIYKGKLYVCSAPAAKRELTSNPEATISRADKNWLNLGPSTYNSESHGFDEPWPFGPESNQQ